jgi:hypothetical protein
MSETNTAGAILSFLAMGIIMFLPLYFLYTFVMGIMYGEYTNVMWYVKLALTFVFFKALTAGKKSKINI